ncbi:MAG: ATP-binding protein [Pseudomonadota bacterium]
MTLRRWLIAWVVLVHGTGLAVAATFAEELGLWFFAIEAGLVLSAIVGLSLVNKALAPLDFVAAFSDVLREREFTSRFSTVGMREMDELIKTYNQMLETLYDERVKIGEQRGFVERFLDATPIGVVLLDFDGRIAMANGAAATFLETNGTPLTGRRFGQLEHPLAVAAGRMDAGESRLVQAGSARRFRLEKDAWVDRGFDREFVLIEELTAVLDESERNAYRKLVRLMSHEVNNTIAATNSLLQSCANYAPQLTEADRTDFVDALQVVIRRNDHLGGFVRDFARVVRLPQPELTPTDLAALIEGLQPIFEAGCRERGIEFTASIAASRPRALADADQLEQVLINVVKNAQEATPAGGTIRVALAIVDAVARLDVIDTGHGIKEDDRDALFSPFFSSKPKGQGLGLTLVKEILLQHGFAFSLESAGGQTRFRIDAPLLTERDRVAGG